MSAAVSVPFRIATHQIRRKLEMRIATAALHATANVAQPIRAAGIRFPASVLGGELLVLMSTQLKDRLPAQGTIHEATYMREAGRAFGALPPPSRAGTTWDEPRAGVHDLRDTPVQSGSAKKPVPGVEIRDSADLPRLPDSVSSERSAIQDRNAGWSLPANDNVLPASWLDAAKPVVRPREPQPAGAMAKQLREYWRLERLAGASRAALVAAPRFGPADHSIGTAPAPPARSSPVHDLRGGQSDVAERLRAFVSEGDKTREQNARERWQRMEQAHLGERLPAGDSRVSAEPQLAGEFADRLSQTLFAQAVQHGIDLT